MNKRDHDRLHNVLYGLVLSVKVGSKVFDVLFRKRSKLRLGEDIGPAARLARTPMGRFAIAEALQAFYESDGPGGGAVWGDLGRGDRSLPPVSALRFVFERERFRFTVLSHHSYPTCRKGYR